jgi:hypothetical protein
MSGHDEVDNCTPVQNWSQTKMCNCKWTVMSDCKLQRMWIYFFTIFLFVNCFILVWNNISPFSCRVLGVRPYGVYRLVLLLVVEFKSRSGTPDQIVLNSFPKMGRLIKGSKFKVQVKYIYFKTIWFNVEIDNHHCFLHSFSLLFKDVKYLIDLQNISIFCVLWTVYEQLNYIIYLLTGYEGIASLLSLRHWLLTEAKLRFNNVHETIFRFIMQNTGKRCVILLFFIILRWSFNWV